MTLWQRWIANRTEIVVPSLLRYEVTNAVYRSARQGLFSEAIAIGIIQSLDLLPVRFFDYIDLNVAAFQLARELDLPAAYDAHYLALAQRERAVLFTADRRLVRAVVPRFSFVRNVMDE
jgi:predicted nucleic acid-binding protein